MTEPSKFQVYRVPPGNETDVEPRAGWYIFADQGEVERIYGPFSDWLDAESAALDLEDEETAND